MNNQHYIEPLIRLIELNEDKQWLVTFQGLRSGGHLPGGGAGSLNDWGPVYADETAGVWYSRLYTILRNLYGNDLNPEAILSLKEIRFRNNLRIIRCLSCGKGYQHPSVFEAHFALDYYFRNFVDLAKSGMLLNLFNPELTYHSEQTNEYRNRMTQQYEQNNIKVYDFVTGDYICPHCSVKGTDTEHDLYVITTVSETEEKLFYREKENADWEDFEKEHLPAKSITNEENERRITNPPSQQDVLPLSPPSARGGVETRKGFWQKLFRKD